MRISRTDQTYEDGRVTVTVFDSNNNNASCSEDLNLYIACQVSDDEKTKIVKATMAAVRMAEWNARCLLRHELYSKWESE